ncbi:MAG: hypothetical protein ABIS69_09765, partial [Sediminibacterium sp.]
MFNLGDDNELDRVSREAAEKFSAPVEANWQALSNELDKIMPVEKKKRRILFYWWLLPVLLIGGTAAYWLIKENNTAAIASIAKKATITPIAKGENKAAPPTTLVTAPVKENTVIAS